MVSFTNTRATKATTGWRGSSRARAPKRQKLPSRSLSGSSARLFALGSQQIQTDEEDGDGHTDHDVQYPVSDRRRKRVPYPVDIGPAHRILALQRVFRAIGKPDFSAHSPR